MNDPRRAGGVWVKTRTLYLFGCRCFYDILYIYKHVLSYTRRTVVILRRALHEKWRFLVSLLLVAHRLDVVEQVDDGGRSDSLQTRRGAELQGQDKYTLRFKQRGKKCKSIKRNTGTCIYLSPWGLLMLVLWKCSICIFFYCISIHVFLFYPWNLIVT